MTDTDLLDVMGEKIAAMLEVREGETSISLEGLGTILHALGSVSEQRVDEFPEEISVPMLTGIDFILSPLATGLAIYKTRAELVNL